MRADARDPYVVGRLPGFSVRLPRVALCNGDPRHWAMALAGKYPEYIDDRVVSHVEDSQREDTS